MTSETNTTDRRRRWAVPAAVAVLVVVAAAALVAWWAGSMHHQASSADDQTMAQRAAQVMPFDLNATTHTFTKTSTGGVEKVVANNPNDQHNITLIRQHLSKEATQFTHGDYSDPATIHGTNMPGLQELQAAGDRVNIKYADVASGATITYSATDPVLVAALHTWFDAQSMEHAMPGIGGAH